MLRLLSISALMIVGLAFAAAAQEATELMEKSTPAFVCTAQTEGQLTCQANRQCTCTYKPAGAGRPARWAWDCGIMRPRCEASPADTSGEGAYPLPPVIIERKKGESEGE